MGALESVRCKLLETRQNLTRVSGPRFSASTPSHNNAVDIFASEWASDLAEVLPGVPHSGTPMFYQDERPRQAARYLGEYSKFENMTILELGPLEGAHSYQLEQLGAKTIVAIESNVDAFLKCLVVKNMLSLNTTYLLGDSVAFLKETVEKFDLIFASGILYHMEDPIELIRLAIYMDPLSSKLI